MGDWTRRVKKRLATLRFRHGSRGISEETRLQEVTGTRRQSHPEEEVEGALLLRPETSGQPPALRLPTRTQRRAALMGGAEGDFARSKNETAGDARRRSSV